MENLKPLKRRENNITKPRAPITHVEQLSMFCAHALGSAEASRRTLREGGEELGAAIHKEGDLEGGHHEPVLDSEARQGWRLVPAQESEGTYSGRGGGVSGLV